MHTWTHSIMDGRTFFLSLSTWPGKEETKTSLEGHKTCPEMGNVEKCVPSPPKYTYLCINI